MGTVVTEGDPFFADAPDRLTGYGVGATFSYRTRDWRHSLSLNFSRTDGSTTAESPAGPNVGYVPGDDAFGNGFSTALGAFATSDLTYDNFGVTYKLRPRSGNGLLSGVFGDRLGLLVALRGSSLEHDGHFEADVNPDEFFADARQDLTSYEIGIGPTFSGRLDLTSRLYLWGSADLELVVRRSELDSEERVCQGCGGTPDLIVIEDDKTSVDVRASVDGAVGFALTPQIDLKLIGGIVLAGRDTIDIRHNPGDDNTHIARRFGADYHAGLRFQWGF